MWTAIKTFLGGISWFRVAIAAGILSAVIGAGAYSWHRVELSYKQDVEIANEKAAHKRDVDQANATITNLQSQYTKDLQVVVQEKNEAQQQAVNAAQQLEVIKHEKQSKTDAVAASVLVNAFDWVLVQPDPYADPTISKTSAASGANVGYAASCKRVLYQSDVANFLTRQFLALDQCRGKLKALRDWAK